ncbi:DUF1269 domain-containing protein [Mycobacterium sp. WMMD1722]|uniref:DUF1269 domain-containing protein n=1 Tax=Mycobacterium sp. WMMD1722 TaxID=3404117 RepID=UPI003BF5B84D
MRLEECVDEPHAILLVAGYRDLEQARSDFTDLDARIKHRGVEVRAAALVARDADGQPVVTHAVNRHRRAAAGMGAGVGVLFGALIPPLLPAVVVGAASAALIASFAEHELKVELEREVGRALRTGSGVVMVIASPANQFHVSQTLRHALEVTVLPMDRATVHQLEQAAAAVLAGAPGEQTGPDSAQP